MNFLLASRQWVRHQKMLCVLVVLSASAHGLALMLAGFELPSPSENGLTRLTRETQVLWTPAAPNDSGQPLRFGWRTDDGAMAIFDPSLIAMARDHGFSSRAATGLTAVVYQWPRQTQTPLLTKASSVVEVRPPAVTEAPLAEFMAARLVKADAPSLEETGDVFLPGSAVSSPAIHIEFENHRSAKLLHAFQWPEAPAEPVSHPAVFRVAVDADGRVRAVVLVSSSGSNEGDEKAAEALRRCTFRATNLTPAPVLSGDAGGGRPPSLDWARAIITWPPPKPSLNVTESSAAEP